MRRYETYKKFLWLFLLTSMLDQMMEMGFAEELVLAALKQTDNNMVAALNMIESEPELLIESSQSTNSGRETAPVPLTDEVGDGGL